MLRDDFANRLSPYRLKLDYNKLKAGKQDFFPVWGNKGNLAQIPRNFVVDLNSKTESLDSWSARQKENWKKIMQATGEAVRPAPYNVLSRFIQPAAFPNFELVFTPSDNEAMLTKAALQTKVTEVFGKAGSPQYKYRVLTWQQASADPNLRLLSSNYFGFYHTWINPAHYQTICTNVGTATLQRPWPSEADATWLDGQLGQAAGTDPGDGSQTSSLISSNKIRAARGMRATVPSQKTVMGDKSTTFVRLCRMLLFPAAHIAIGVGCREVVARQHPHSEQASS